MQTPAVSFVLVAVSLCAPAIAQQIWKVNCAGGPGVHFTDLPPAVAAAAPGDEIWVYRNVISGSGAGCPPGWPDYTAPIITKPVRIVGFQLENGYAAGIPTATAFRGVFVIHGIPAGQQVVLSNLSLGQDNLVSPGGIVAIDCAGDILLEDVAYTSLGTPGSYVHFERCANVVLRGCDIRLGGWPLRFIDSTALLTTTFVAPVSIWPGIPYEQTSEALRVSNSNVTLIGSVLYGNDGYYPPPNPAFPQQDWRERPAAVIESGTLRVGPATYLYGGLTGYPYPLNRAWAYRFAPPATGTVEQDPRSLIYLMPDPPFVPPPIPTDIPATYHAWVVGGENFAVTVIGPPNGFALLAVGDWQPVPMPTSLGPLAITPCSLTILELAPLSASIGSFEWTLHCPTSAVVAHAFALQAAVLAPNGTLSLTVPSPLTVGWPHGQIP